MELLDGMEPLDGRSFDQYVREGADRVTPEEVARIIIEVLDVLAAAHARGVVHRDIKPGTYSRSPLRQATLLCEHHLPSATGRAIFWFLTDLWACDLRAA